MSAPLTHPTPAYSPAPPGERPLNVVIEWTFYLLVFSIPFEFPDRSFPVEIPTLTAALFLCATVLQPSACYARRPVALIAFVVYLYVFCLSAALNGRDHVATDLITSDYGGQVVKLFALLLQCVLVFWAGYNLLRSRTLARHALLAFAASCALRALLPLIGIGRTAHEQWGGGERITAFGQNANNSAMILAAGFIALLGLRYGLDRPLVRHRWLVWPGSALILVSVVETGSRGGLVALGFGLLVFAAWSGRTLWHQMRNAVVGTVAIGAVIFASYNNPLVRRRFEQSFERGALAGRERIYPALWGMFKEKPLIGLGPVNNKYELGIRLDERVRRRRDAHNLILEVLTSTGLTGVIPFALGAALSVAAAWRARRRAHGVLPFALAPVVLTANMSGNWIASKLLWLVLAYGLASLSYATAAARQPTPAKSPRPLIGPVPTPRRTGRPSTLPPAPNM